MKALAALITSTILAFLVPLGITESTPFGEVLSAVVLGVITTVALFTNPPKQ